MAKLSNESKKSSTVGEMVNLMSKDATRMIVFEIQFLLFGPLLILTALYLLYQEMGVSTFVGFSILVVLIPVNAYIAKRHRKIEVIYHINLHFLSSSLGQLFIVHVKKLYSMYKENKLNVFNYMIDIIV
jgi:hypothetical protein